MTANIVSLADVRAHLRFPNPAMPSDSDTALQGFIDAADEVIKFECGDILPQMYSEHYDGANYRIVLRHAPILEVMNVEEGWGWINYELDFAEVNSPAAATSMFAYSIDSYESAVISRRSAGNVQIPFRAGTDNIFIQYKAGEHDVPGNVRLAELELIAHWWQNSQQRGISLSGGSLAYDAVQGAIFSRDTETGLQSINLGVPYRILELIKSHRKNVIIG